MVGCFQGRKRERISLKLSLPPPHAQYQDQLYSNICIGISLPPLWEKWRCWCGKTKASLSQEFFLGGEVRCYVQRGLLLHTPLTIMVFPLSDNNRRRRRPPGGSQDVEATVRTMIRQIKKTHSISICNTFFKCFCQETQGNKGQKSFIFWRISYQARPPPPPSTAISCLSPPLPPLTSPYLSPSVGRRLNEKIKRESGMNLVSSISSSPLFSLHHSRSHRI